MATSTVQAVPKLYDVIMWLMGRVEKFPRSQFSHSAIGS